MLRTCCVCCDKGKVDVCAGHTGKLDLCFFSSFLESLESHLIVAEVDAAVFFLECVCDPVDDAVVEVVAAELGVTVGCENLKYAVGDFENGNVERTAAKVKDHDLLVAVFVDTVSERCRCGLVDDTKNFKTCDLTCILSCLSLCIGEVSRNGDNRLRNGRAEVAFCVSLELLKHHRGDLLRSELLTVDVYFIIGAHMTFDTHNGLIGVCDRLSFCDLTNHSFAVLRKRNDGRSGSAAFGVGDNSGFAAFKYCYTRVGCTKVNTNNFCHNYISSK